jgi:hypothetical protein
MTVEELFAGLSLAASGTATRIARSATRVSAPYLGGSTTIRGHSLAGYQLLWKALPIARREETTVTAQ